MRSLRFTDLVPLAAGCHVARSFYHPGHASGRHSHDFAEAMWIEMGAVRHDSGRSVRLLTAGDILLVRPRHEHDIRGIDDQIGIVVNVAIPAAALAAIERRYNCRDLWGSGTEPQVRRLSSDDIAVLGRRVEALRTGPDDALARDAFLATLLDRLRPRQAELWRNSPAWLATAMSRCTEPPLLAQGMAALMRLTRRSRDHISRSIHASTGMTAMELFTELRVRWAERQLALSDLPVAEIATGCGIGRARLHQLFALRHGRGPRDYRLACRSAVG
jgi:AraC family transcriptional regulator, dual regulator of chb operon